MPLHWKLVKSFYIERSIYPSNLLCDQTKPSYHGSILAIFLNITSKALARLMSHWTIHLERPKRRNIRKPHSTHQKQSYLCGELSMILPLEHLYWPSPHCAAHIQFALSLSYKNLVETSLLVTGIQRMER